MAREHNHLYNYQWQKFRLLFLKENPLCVYCLNDGMITPANVVDHINPHRGDMKLFWDRNNMQSLCNTHHASTKQAMERNGRKKFNVDGWPN